MSNEQVEQELSPAEPVAPNGKTWRRKVSLLAMALTVFSSAALTVLYHTVGDTTPWGEYLTIWPSFLWCFVLIPMALPTIDLKKKRNLGISLLAVLLFAILTADWFSLVRWGQGGKTASQRRIRVVSWNVNSLYGGRKTILDELERLKPDVCFLQEAPPSREFYKPSELTGYWSGFHAMSAGDCAFLSRFGMTLVGSQDVGPWSEPMPVLLKLPEGKRLLAVNVRLMLPSLELVPLSAEARRRLRNDNQMRTEQYRKLTQLIHQLRQQHDLWPLILAGDFNCPGTARSLAPLRNMVSDVWPEYGRGWGATITAQFPVSRIDQCWVTNELQPLAARVYGTKNSDHRILCVDLVLP